MISIYGTSHIAEESLSNVKKIIREKKPDLIALELDESRLRALLGDKGVKGKKTFLFFLLEKVQRYFGKKVEIMPGREMLEAFYEAQNNGVRVALIDQNIEVTANKINRAPLKEKLKVFLGVLAIFLPLKARKMNIEIDLRKVPPPEVIDTVLLEFKKYLPTFYKILITERNKIMAEKLKVLEKEYKNIIAFVGAGHVKGMQKILEIDS